jgi:outer membrane protein OmpA-like peptidoglycan-associated protein
MRNLLFFFLPLLFPFVSAFSQVDFTGVWQGIMVKDGYKNEQGSLIYLQFSIDEKKVEGKSRDEVNNTEFEKQKNPPKIIWCNIDAKLVYNEQTGYLEGKYTSSDCSRNTGKLILYKSNNAFSATEKSPAAQSWFALLIKDLKSGYSAPFIRESERTNFVFQPIYFDYDQAIIRSEYTDFLKRMIRVVNGHSDLRIKVTGHTDSDGSDAYNVELSKKRAQALIDFFVTNGLSRDKIEVEFKGESAPIDSNKTPQGKQRNRRVDFAFI